MPDLREVRISIGSRNYPMQTELDDDTFKRVVGILDEVSATLGGKIDHEKLMVLMCLQLAYKLEKFSDTLESLDKKLNDAIKYKN